MDVMEIGRYVCLGYIFLVAFIGINFSLSFLFRDKNMDAHKRLLIWLLIMAGAIVFGLVPFLFIGTYAIAVFQTEKQRRSRANE